MSLKKKGSRGCDGLFCVIMPGLMNAQIAGGTLFLMSVMMSLEEVGISISKLSNEDMP